MFQALSRDYLATWDTWWEKAPKEFLHAYYSGARTSTRQEMIILSQVLADEINIGYEGLYSESVVSVNGKKPRDMAHFVALVETSTSNVQIRTSTNALIVLDVKGVAERGSIILDRYRIERDRSTNLPAAGITRPPKRKTLKPRKKAKR